MLSGQCQSQCIDAPVGLTGDRVSVKPMLLFSAELVQFSVSLSFFFVFYFAWAFYFIPGIYNCSVDKLISPIDCVVTQSPKSQNNGLLGPCSLHTSTDCFHKDWLLMEIKTSEACSVCSACTANLQRDWRSTSSKLVLSFVLKNICVEHDHTAVLSTFMILVGLSEERCCEKNNHIKF